LRLSERRFAEKLGASLRTVASWDARGETISPNYEMQAILDTCLARADEAALARFMHILTAASCPACGNRLRLE
jgi:hypothetical protein